jgi:cytochrome c-type biogenesis protein CcmF
MWRAWPAASNLSGGGGDSRRVKPGGSDSELFTDQGATMSTLGNLLLSVSALAAIFSIGALVLGHRLGPREGEPATNAGYIATFVIAASTTVATLLLTLAFFREDWSLQYVVMNHSTDVSSLAWLFKLSAVWAGREGSLLFWAWLLTLFAAYMAYKRMSVTDPLSNIGIAVTNFVQLFFLAALAIPTNNPFVATPAGWVDAAGKLTVNYAMIPLLQHWAMILHPPTLFIGYAGLTIPFAFAVAALIVNDGSKRWVELVDRIAVFSWLFLGIGIGLGAIWAYVVLGWGGYWAWDPVENASLLPWLTGVGLLHSFTVYRRREGFKVWAVMMAAISFVLVLLGTWITRSGVLGAGASVHTFGEDPWSLWLFFGMMVASLAVPAVGLYLRRDQFSSDDDSESLLSKESSYYFNNVIMLFSALVVTAMTMAPALFKGLSFGPASYDLLARPFGILYVAIMSICPILSWRKTEGADFWKRARWPLGIGGVISVGLLAIWATVMLPNYSPDPKRLTALKGLAGALPAIDHTEAVIGLLVAGFAIALPLYLFFDGARKRAASKSESLGVALFRILTKARTQSGGYLTHLGIGIILVGLIGSAMYVKDLLPTMGTEKGSKFSAGGYDFVLTGTSERTLANGDVESTVNLDLMKNGVKVGTASPGQLAYAVQEQTRLNADVHVEFFRDVFVAYQGQQGENLAFNVKINPMISWTWAGFVLTIVGAALASWPKKRPELAAVAARPVPRPTPSKSPAKTSGKRKK